MFLSLVSLLFLPNFFLLKLFFTCRSGRDGPLLSSEKKVDKDSQKGFAPLNPIPAPCGQSSSFFRAAGRLSGPSAANRRLTGKRLKSQGAELSFSSVSVRRGTSAPFRQSPPFLSLLAGLRGPSGRKPPAGMGNARKAKGAELSFSGVSVRGGMFGPTFYIFIEIWRELLPGSREQESSFFPAWENRSRALGLHSKKNACVRGAGKEKTGCAICPAQPRGHARRGEGKDRESDLLGAARAGRARRGEGKDRESDLLGAAARACETRRRKRQGERLARRSRAGVRGWAKAQTRCVSCPPQVR